MQKEEKYKKRGEDYPLLDNAKPLPSRYYCSEEIYQKELEVVFGKRWFLVARAEEIPEPGDFITKNIGKESILIVRDKAKKIKAHFNVCRHRGTRICNLEKGKFESKMISCPYHAWTYGLDGELVSAPLMNKLEKFDKQSFPLYPAHIYVWGGFIFLNIAEQPAPFEEEMAHLIGKFEDWKLPELRIAASLNYELNCNWKLIFQNYQECYHCPGVHPMLSEQSPFRSAVHDCFSSSVIGGYMEISRKGGSLTTDGGLAGPVFPDLPEEQHQRVHYYSIFPNMLLTLHPDYVMYHRITPVAYNKIKNDCFFLLRASTIADEEKMERFQTAVKFWDITNREDWQVCEQMQLGIASSRFTSGYYSGQEDILAALDKEFIKALGEDYDDVVKGQ